MDEHGRPFKWVKRESRQSWSIGSGNISCEEVLKGELRNPGGARGEEVQSLRSVNMTLSRKDGKSDDGLMSGPQP
jgi:hypothetical protein